MRNVNLKWWDGSLWQPVQDLPESRIVAASNAYSTVTTLVASPSSVAPGGTVTLTATVKRSTGAAVTAGSVKFQWYGSMSGASPTWHDVDTEPASPWSVQSGAIPASTPFRALYLGSGSYLPSTSPTVTVSASTVKTYVKTYACAWSQSYDSDNTKRTDSAHLYQGYYSGTHGNQRSQFGWAYAAVAADLAGATLIKAEIYLNCLHWGPDSGGTVMLGYHNNTAAPTIFGVGAYGGYNLQAAGWTAKTGAKWIVLNATLLAQIAALRARGLTIGPPASNALEYYGYFAGNGETGEPVLRLTYSK